MIRPPELDTCATVKIWSIDIYEESTAYNMKKWRKNNALHSLECKQISHQYLQNMHR